VPRCGKFKADGCKSYTFAFTRTTRLGRHEQIKARARLNRRLYVRRSHRRLVCQFISFVGGRRTYADGCRGDELNARRNLVCLATGDAEKDFGYYRLEILAAFINGIALVLISLWVIYEAYERWSAPPEIKGFALTAIAVGGLIINLICAYLLHGDHEHDLNMRGAWLHVVGDALGSVTAIAAGTLILAFGWLWADAASSVLISLIIIVGAWNLIKESVNVLLEGTPAHINLKAVEDAIRATENVEDVHDLHVWTITSGMEALSVHIIHHESVSQKELLKSVRARLHDEFGIDHLTIQMETLESEVADAHPCFSGANCFESEVKVRATNN
jgi:cation diffusion facilitator family transporter